MLPLPSRYTRWAACQPTWTHDDAWYPNFPWSRLKKTNDLCYKLTPHLEILRFNQLPKRNTVFPTNHSAHSCILLSWITILWVPCDGSILHHLQTDFDHDQIIELFSGRYQQPANFMELETYLPPLSSVESEQRICNYFLDTMIQSGLKNSPTSKMTGTENARNIDSLSMRFSWKLVTFFKYFPGLICPHGLWPSTSALP